MHYSGDFMGAMEIFEAHINSTEMTLQVTMAGLNPHYSRYKKTGTSTRRK